MRPPRGRGDAGFTLIEALVALAIGGFIIASLATVTGQWLRGWNRGLAVLQRADLLTASLDRLGADLAAALFVPAESAGRDVLFTGSDSEVTLVRRALPVEGPPVLEVVRWAPQPGNSDVTLQRSRTSYTAGQDKTGFRDPAAVIVLRAPLRIQFAYAGADQRWQAAWRGMARPPAAVRIDVVDRTTGRSVFAPLVVAVHATAPTSCASVRSAKNCNDEMQLPPPLVPRDAGPGRTLAEGQL